MPWNRNAPDPDNPLEIRRRQLAEQERLLAEEMSRLSRELNDDPLPEEIKPVEPPVWRMEDDGVPRAIDSTPTRKRNLARQRQRDMILFFVFIGLLLVALAIFFWIWHSHYAALTNGA